MTKDRIGGLVFLVICIAYAYAALHIELSPTAELEVINARALPLALGILGAIVALGMILLPPAKTSSLAAALGGEELEAHVSLRQGQWKTLSLLVVLMLIYSVLLEPLGFVVATTGFLIVGYWILGERKIKRLVLASLPIVLALWGIFYLLDIYLPLGVLSIFI